MTDFENIAQEAQAVFNTADLIHSSDAIDQALSEMATQIERDYADKIPLVLCVMNGGLMTTARLISKVGIPMQVDYIHATRYANKTTGANVQWLAEPKMSLAGRDVIIVDDILDEGVTLSELISYCKRHECRSVKTAMLIRKLHDRRINNLEADYLGLDVPDRYVFGCGMDYKSFYRNLPGIYAVSE
ncbi:hypoxanthine-guanine phosphoribosyltransferase [Sessilibacter corallicola]|uniref:Hypoxanthine-guanine phosphoribosyltransferase n=1 Tax=Sessilibacter corallicola TaxID=2904075 RepID=A0ABQ0A4C1_9GAMM|nr:hypoxanthine-guanine phosphoribosyltransferase [Sessilibacter corallicola]